MAAGLTVRRILGGEEGLEYSFEVFRGDAHAVIGEVYDYVLPAPFGGDFDSPRLVSAQRTKAPVVALTPTSKVYHALNLLWGVRPLLVAQEAHTIQDLLGLAERTLLNRGLAAPGDRVLVVAGLPMGQPRGTNLAKIHTIAATGQP